MHLSLQKAGEKEYELTNMKKESQGSTVQAFVVVDPEAGVGYAIKVTKVMQHVLVGRTTVYYIV